MERPRPTATLGAGLRARALDVDPLLVALVALQVLVAAIVAALAAHEGWLYGTTDTASLSTTAADEIARLRLPDTGIGYAWPLLLAPLVAVVGPDPDDVLPVLVVLQVGVLVPLGVVLVWDVGRHLGGRLAAAAAAVAWVALPPASMLLFTSGYREVMVDDALPALLGLTARPELPAAVALLGAASLLLRSTRADRAEEAALAGALAAFAAGIVATALGFLVGAALLLTAARRPVPALAFAAGLVPGLLALAVWRWRVLGGLEVTLGPLSWDAFSLSMASLREHFWSNRLLQWLPLAGAIGLWRLSARGMLLAAGWTAAFVLTTASSESPAASFAAAGFFVSWIPGLPPYLLLVAAVPLLVPTLKARLGDRLDPAPPGRRPGALAVGVGAALLCALPLLVVLTLRT